MQIRANKIIDPDAYALFVGETRAAYFERRASVPSFLTPSPLAAHLEGESERRWAASLIGAGYTHLLISMPELKRLDKSYGFSGLTQDHKQKIHRLVHSPFCRAALEDLETGEIICELVPAGAKEMNSTD